MSNPHPTPLMQEEETNRCQETPETSSFFNHSRLHADASVPLAFPYYTSTTSSSQLPSLSSWSRTSFFTHATTGLPAYSPPLESTDFYPSDDDIPCSDASSISSVDDDGYSSQYAAEEDEMEIGRGPFSSRWSPGSWYKAAWSYFIKPKSPKLFRKNSKFGLKYRHPSSWSNIPSLWDRWTSGSKSPRKSSHAFNHHHHYYHHHYGSLPFSCVRLAKKWTSRRFLTSAVFYVLGLILFAFSLDRLGVFEPSSTEIKYLDPQLYSMIVDTTKVRPDRPRVALINRHYGCYSDFLYLSKHLDFSFTQFSYQLLYRHSARKVSNIQWLSEQDANLPAFKNLADLFCDHFDIVLVADINPDARFLLQRIDADPLSCGIRKVVMLTTNRFNYYATDLPPETEGYEMKPYMNLMKRVTNRALGPKVVWIANNPWEEPYAHIKLGGPFINFTDMIRPFGYSALQAPTKIPEHDTRFAAVRTEGFNFGFYDILLENNIPVMPINRKYGGPSVLAQYKAYLELPYQVSTMKMYENLANGVVTVIPSARLYKEILKSMDLPWSLRPRNLDFWGLFLMNFRPEYFGRDWERYMDYYHEDLADLFYTFDSYEELRDIVTRPVLDIKNLKKKQVEAYHKIRVKSVQQWSKVFELPVFRMPTPILVDNNGTLVKNESFVSEPDPIFDVEPRQNQTTLLSLWTHRLWNVTLF